MISANNMIQRNRLIKLAEDLSDCHILYVQAPAGYGKTVFASQWLDNRREPGAVVTLDEYDNKAADICYKLKSALEDLGLGASEETVSGLIRHPDFYKAPVEFLMRAVMALPKDTKACIVIDDLHYMTDSSAQKVLCGFLTRLPQGIQICILSRSAFPESFSGLFLKNQLRYISQEELLFDNHEICELYKSRDLTISNARAEEILKSTEGWPLGINALLLAANQVSNENMSQEWLENFLETQVWELWDECAREFMVSTCMEEELSESLCNALTGKSNSSRMLECLVKEGAFLYRYREGRYRFHKIFRDFLRKLFMARPEKYRTSQIRSAGKWYLGQKDFYHAVERFSYIKDYEQIACCFDILEHVDRAGFDAEQVMYAVRDTLGEEILTQYPQLYFMMAFTARNEGRIEEFLAYADQYYQHYPQIVERNPELSHNIFFLYIMDFRYTLKDIYRLAVNTQSPEGFQGVRGSATLYFPFYHKSYRDFSELLPGDMDAEIEQLGQALGALLGEECEMLKKCILGGLYYEQGNHQRAQELALSAVAKLQSGFAPESKFCAMMLMLTVLHAMGQSEQEELVQRDIQKMIENDRAFYLQFNFDAVICRYRLDLGDRDAAKNWIDMAGMDVDGQIDFFRLCGHFTTARAYMALGDFNHAIILLEKILDLCVALKRPVDIIETEILLAISFWKKHRCNRKKASFYLEEAVKSAQNLGYEQVFINDGADLKNILSVLKNWTMRSDYDGEISSTFVRKLYIGATEQADCGNSLTGSRNSSKIKLTPKQKSVATLMCQGYSYRKIAEELGIQFSTVRSHIELIYRKLDVSGMDEAILKIQKLNLL